MIQSVSIPAKQIRLLATAQAAFDKAKNDLEIICATILSGLETQGQIVAVDLEKNTISIETSDEKVEA